MKLGNEVVFSKTEQIAKNDFSCSYADLRLEWLLMPLNCVAPNPSERSD